MQDAPQMASAVVTRAVRCRASDDLETQARMVSWRPWVRHCIITAGGSDCLAMVDAGRENLMPADSAAALQLFTLSQP